MEAIPKLALEVLKAHLKVFSHRLQLNLEELLLHLSSRQHSSIVRPAGDAPLQIMKVSVLESVELWEIVLGEDQVLAVEASLQLEKAVADGIDRVFEALIPRHIIHIL
jgi:hypothetical protein